MAHARLWFAALGSAALAASACQGAENEGNSGAGAGGSAGKAAGGSSSGRAGGTGVTGGSAGRGGNGSGGSATGGSGTGGSATGGSGVGGSGTGGSGVGGSATGGSTAGGDAGSAAGGSASGAGRGPTGGSAGRATGGAGSTGGTTGGTGGTTSGASGTASGESGAGGDTTGPSGNAYDDAVLADGPVAYLAMNQSGTETDLTGHGHDGTYHGGGATTAKLPNGDDAAEFDGSSQYLSVPSHAALSIPTTKNFTWEAWIRPKVVDFEEVSSGYVDWMGKCEEYAPTCEWEARMYNQSSDRCSRLSAYAFNPGADLGSGAYWEATECGTIEAGSWYHIVGEYTTESGAGDENCDNADEYPGVIAIWVNGVPWKQSSHGQTGCMSQYEVKPVANDSPINVGTMAKDAWFEGAIGKLAFYDYRLSDAKIKSHYALMTGEASTGSCNSTCSF